MLLVRTKLAQSMIDGIGLFAAEHISKGTIVWEFNPVIDMRIDGEKLSSLPAACKEQMRKYTYREINSGLYVLCGDDARFFNHSNEPNCLDIQDEAHGDITVAARDISEGEELTCNYALFDQDMIEGFYKL